MPSRPRTSRTDLDSLPQFEPDHTFRLEEGRHESALPFAESRIRQIRDVLSWAMKDHVRQARFLGEPTSLERFLGNAMLAIATYESRSLRRRAYDRERAHSLLDKVHRALCAFQRALERTVEWKQLERYLESLFVADRKRHRRQHVAVAASGQPAAMLRRHARELVRQRERADRYREQFGLRSPRAILKQVGLLEPLLTLALEKLEFQPGDAQRDEIVREFADAMVFAWKSATGAIPTISKSKPLPFQRLLATINREILEPEIRHRTDFQYPAVRAADMSRKREKGEIPRQ
jgi:hypothetical protein